MSDPQEAATTPNDPLPFQCPFCGGRCHFEDKHYHWGLGNAPATLVYAPRASLDLDAIQKRADAATAGPWDYITQGVIGRADQSSEDAMDNPVAMVRWSELDAEFIAHARTDVPALVAAVRSRDAEVAELRAEKERWHDAALIGLAQESALAREVAELKAKIAEIRGLHWPKRGSTPRYASDDFEHEGEPVEWEDYMICNHEGTTWPCKSAQILGSASSPVEGGN